MAKEYKYKFPQVVTPVGIFKFAYLDKPDAGYDPKADPKYKVRLLLDDTDQNRLWIKETEAKGREEAKKAGIKIKKISNCAFKFPEDQDEDDYVPAEGKDRAKLDEDHVGRIFIDFKSGFKPGIIDAKRTTLAEDTLIMSGDTGRVKVTLNPYEGLGSGISYRLSVVQLIEKNTSFSSGTINTSGFDDIVETVVVKEESDVAEDEDF